MPKRITDFVKCFFYHAHYNEINVIYCVGTDCFGADKMYVLGLFF